MITIKTKTMQLTPTYKTYRSPITFSNNLKVYRPELVVKDTYEIVFKVFEVDEYDIKNKKRNRYISEARHVVADLIYKYTNYSLNYTGLCVGGKHYSTIISSLKKVSDLNETDKAFSERYNACLRIMNSKHNLIRN